MGVSVPSPFETGLIGLRLRHPVFVSPSSLRLYDAGACMYTVFLLSRRGCVQTFSLATAGSAWRQAVEADGCSPWLCSQPEPLCACG